MVAPYIPTEAMVRDELERILASAPFANAVRSQRFLRYVAEHSLCNADEPLKEYSIAVEAFDRGASYDPAIDATVRVEAGRMRSRLRDYYADAGRNDPLLIEIPRGSYRAVFIQRAPVAELPPSLPPPEPPSLQKPPRKGRTRVPWAGGAVALIPLIIAGVVFMRDHHPPVASTSSQTNVLAVLPFSNQTGSEENNYLSEGLTDNLIRQFSALPRLRVLSRIAVDSVDRKNVVSRLGATVVLAGELQRNSEGHLVLNAELSNARDGTVLRSSQYLPDEADLRPVQADIVRDVILGLGMELQARESAIALRPLTSSPIAFQDFLRAESAMENGDEAGMLTAIQLFNDAVKNDGSFAEAFAAMAEAQEKVGFFFEPPRTFLEAARHSAERAVALDPTNTAAHGVLGLIHLAYDWDFSAAQRDLSNVDQRQNAIWQLGCTAHLLERSGNYRNAEEDLERMLEFNPGAASLIAELGCVNYYAGRYDESIRYYHESLAQAPQGVLAAWGLARSLSREGRYAEALEVLRHFNSAFGIEHPLLLSEIGYIQALSGDRQGALATMDRLRFKARKEFVDPYFLAVIYRGLKDRENTYRWLDKAYDIRSPFLVSIATDPKWSGSQSDPRFQELWNRMTHHRHADQAAETR